MVKTARFTEESIVYGNRYRSENSIVDKDLSRAEVLFYKGNYKEAFDVSMNTINSVDPTFKETLLNAYNSTK